ncbi:protein SLOW GREEN 1, chloroplastic-like [Phalaenopsis equestris]|uniref:protein SLOW GREEN 1, chloroplastic-like n=1 Tax=Phalaenopsis equestris TaxID=78828 RepID=UPI0009E2DB22|nr:protein SLOW GREEN 1, chloroplastic-like [Phalaenopsis equestris]
MESLSFSKTLYHSFPHLPISSRFPSSVSPKSRILKPFPKTLTLIRSSHQTPTQTLQSLSVFLKPAILSLTAAAAVFFSRRSLPSLAAVVHPPPAAQSENLSSSDEHSEEVLEQHLASHPDDVDSLRALVQLKVKQQKLPEAIAVVDRLVLLDPTDPELHLLRAHLHTYSGDTEKAREGFEEILSANPFVVEAYHGLVMAASRSVDMKELDRVVERVEGVIQRCKKENRWKELRDFKLLVAQVLIIEGKYQEALKMYQEMVKDEPRDFRPYLCQGIVYTLMRKTDEANKHFKQYRKLVPKNHPYAQLFESNLSGINAALKKKDDNVTDSSLQS